MEKERVGGRGNEKRRGRDRGNEQGRVCEDVCVCERERYQRGGSDVKKKREGGRGHSVGERERTRERGEGGQ